MKRILLTLTIGLCTVLCFGQTNYYKDLEQTFTWTDENGKTITYIYDYGDLYNKDNKYIGKPWVPKDGSNIAELLRGYPDLFTYISPNMHIGTIVEVAYSVIPEQYKAALGNEGLFGTFYFDSQTGELTDVDFSIDEETGWAYIPPEIYYEIEKALKNCGFRVTPSDVGRKMTYLIHGWDIGTL